MRKAMTPEERKAMVNRVLKKRSLPGATTEWFSGTCVFEPEIAHLFDVDSAECINISELDSEMSRTDQRVDHVEFTVNYLYKPFSPGSVERKTRLKLDPDDPEEIEIDLDSYKLGVFLPPFSGNWGDMPRLHIASRRFYPQLYAIVDARLEDPEFYKVFELLVLDAARDAYEEEMSE